MEIKNLGYNGILLPDANILLDGSGSGSSDADIFISHAHADHVPGNRRSSVTASPATAALMRARGHSGPVNELPFGKPMQLPRARVTLYPAGHILGSSMILVETADGSLLYTGDCRTPPSPASEGFLLPDIPVDYLIIEATFALPIYKWRPYDVLFRQLCDFVHECLSEDATPVLLCYNLGKAQEVMHALARCDPPVTVQIHSAGEKLCVVYEQFGVDLGTWEPYDRTTLDGKVLVTPSSTLESPMIRNIRKRRVAYISGWASLESRASQLLADALIPLSDHLDFFSLLDVCRALKPRHIRLTHSPNPDTALYYLRKEGFSCSSLDSDQPIAQVGD